MNSPSRSRWSWCRCRPQAPPRAVESSAMTRRAIAIQRTGLVTSVGLDAPASCAAFRAKLTNPGETRFADAGGDWIMGHAVPLGQAWCGPARLVRMACMALEETLEGIPKTEWNRLPLLLCVAEPDRPGRADGLDDQLFQLIQAEIGVRFAEGSAIVTQGRVGVAVAMAQARSMMASASIPRVVVVAVDSLLSW